MTDRLTLSAELADRNEHQNVGEQASRAFLHSLIQSPVNGVVQIADKTFGTNVLASVQFIAAPHEAEFLSLGWHAQQVGQAAGMIPWFVGLHKGSSALLNRAAGIEAKAVVGLAESGAAGTVSIGEGRLATRTAERFLSRKTAVEVGASALSGLTYGAFLAPTRPDEDFLSGRARNAASSALTFATLGGTMRGLESMGLRSPTLAGVLSGVPAGFVAAESHSLLSGKGLASGREVGKSIYGFTLIGGGFGFVQGRMETSLKGPEAKAVRTDGSGKGLPQPAVMERPLAASIADVTTGGVFPRTITPVRLEITVPAERAATGGKESSPVVIEHGPSRGIEIPPLVPVPSAPRGSSGSKPADLTVGQKISMPSGDRMATLEVATMTERMAVLRRDQLPPGNKELSNISTREFENGYVPVEVTINGQPQTRYIQSSTTQIRSQVWRVEKTAGDRVHLVADNNFVGVNRPEVIQWADTARMKAGGPGTPQVDWSLVPDLRSELNGGDPPRGPQDILMGHESIYSGGSTDFISVRRRGDTIATSSQRTGTVVLEKPGEPWAAELKDGRRITMESPGPWEVATPSQRVIIKDADGHVEIRDWNGDMLHIIRNPDAPRYMITLGGPGEYPVMTTMPKSLTPEPLSARMRVESNGRTVRTWLSDGTRVEQPLNAKWEAIRPDGSKFNSESPGPWEIIDSMGCRLSKDAAGVLRRHESNRVREWYPDGTTVTDNLSGHAGIKYTEKTKAGSPTLRIYDDPAVPGQQVTQIGRIVNRISGADFDWEAVGPDGQKFNFDSNGPWEVTLLDGETLKKDAAGNLIETTAPGRSAEYRADGDRIFTDLNSTRIYKADKTQYVLYHGCTTYLKISPDGKITEVASPNEPPPKPPKPQEIPPTGDPFDYW